MDNEYRRVRDLRDMVAEEKSTTAEDQLTMFNRAAKVHLISRKDISCVPSDVLGQ